MSLPDALVSHTLLIAETVSRIDHVLEKCVQELPVEVVVELSQRGSFLESGLFVKKGLKQRILNLIVR